MDEERFVYNQAKVLIQEIRTAGKARIGEVQQKKYSYLLERHGAALRRSNLTQS